MASICPVCNADNRKAASFCLRCGSKLSPAVAPRMPRPAPAPGPDTREWLTTAPAQLRAPTIPAPLFDMRPPPAPPMSWATAGAPADERTVIPSAATAARATAGSSSAAGDEDKGRHERSEHRKARAANARAQAPAAAASAKPAASRALWVWGVLLVVALTMIVAGWNGFGTRKAATPAPVAVEAPAAAADVPPIAAGAPRAAAEPAPAATPPVAPEAAPAAVAPQPAEPVASAETPQAAQALPVKPAATPAKPRRQAAAVPPPMAPEVPPAPVAAAPAPPLAAPAPPPDPQAQCGDRNFIARAQCMASQCLKAEFRGTAQCEAVRQQQRIDEEKRNPSMAN